MKTSGSRTDRADRTATEKEKPLFVRRRSVVASARVQHPLAWTTRRIYLNSLSLSLCRFYCREKRSGTRRESMGRIAEIARRPSGFWECCWT